METLTATTARRQIDQLIESVEQNHDTIQITGKATNAILIAESDWNVIQEILVPGMRASIKKALKTHRHFTRSRTLRS